MGFNGLRNKLLHYQNKEYQGGLQFHNSGLTIKEPLESNWNGLILHNHIYNKTVKIKEVEDVYCDMLEDSDWLKASNDICAILEYNHTVHIL
jgi:hypothetical protein